MRCDVLVERIATHVSETASLRSRNFFQSIACCIGNTHTHLLRRTASRCSANTWATAKTLTDLFGMRQKNSSTMSDIISHVFSKFVCSRFCGLATNSSNCPE